MKLTLLSLFLSLSLFAFAQNQLGEPIEKEVEYYKKGFLKSTNPQEAEYKLTKASYEGGKRLEKMVKIEGEETVYFRFYVNNIPKGTWIEHTDRNGVVAIDFNQMYCEEFKALKTEVNPEIQLPIYNETETDFYNEISILTRYPDYAKYNAISGSVFMNFKIDTSGYIQDVCIVQGVHFSLDAEAYRTIHLLSRFNKAAQKNGKPIEYEMTVPIQFNLR